MKQTMKEVCTRCKGYCCHHQIFLGERDIKKLRTTGKKFKLKSAGKAGFDLVHEGKCPFLDKDGCGLPEKLKPIDCILFPLAFTEENGEFSFYLNSHCPCFEEVPNDWIEETVKWTEGALKEWSEKERETYTKRQVDYLRDIKEKNRR